MEVEGVWFVLGQCAPLAIGGGRRMKVEQELGYCLEVDVVFVEWTVVAVDRWVGAGGRLVVVGMMVVGVRGVIVLLVCWCLISGGLLILGWSSVGGLMLCILLHKVLWSS